MAGTDPVVDVKALAAAMGVRVDASFDLPVADGTEERRDAPNAVVESMVLAQRRHDEMLARRGKVIIGVKDGRPDYVERHLVSRVGFRPRLRPRIVCFRPRTGTARGRARGSRRNTARSSSRDSPSGSTDGDPEPPLPLIVGLREGGQP